jgi:serine/threonine protein phosphatase PrpC
MNDDTSPPDVTPPPDVTEAVRDLPTEAPSIGRVLPMRERDIEAGQPLRRPEVSLDAVSARPWRAAGASLVGLAHTAAGTCRQDAFGLYVDASGRLIAALADGLGSREASQLGAHLFVESVGHVLRSGSSGGTLASAELLAQASARTEHVADAGYGLGPKELSCTGLVAVLAVDGGEVARVGDVSAFRLVGGEFTEVFEHDGQYVNIVGASLPGRDVSSTVEVQPLPTDATLIFATDGLAGDIRTSEGVRAWLGPAWATPLTAFAMGDTLRFRRQGSHDDRTGIVVWRV